ncbi:MAG: acylphosphatase [Kiritimatiellia bacterium]
MTARVHLKIYGRVQGVCFRHFCREEALRIGLKGYVRNNDDGCVEAVAEGDKNDVRAFAAWCRRGPPSANVTKLEENYEQPSGEYNSFSVTG